FPDELWDLSAGLSYRHKFDNGWTGGVSLTVGTASDRPFNSIDEMYFRFFSLVRVPQGEHNVWLFTFIYARDVLILGRTLPLHAGPGTRVRVAAVAELHGNHRLPVLDDSQQPVRDAPPARRVLPVLDGPLAGHLGDLSTATRVRRIPVGQRSLLPRGSRRQVR